MSDRVDEILDEGIRIDYLSGLLKPCPFCGGNARVEDMGWPHHVYCTECGAKVTSIKAGREGEYESVAKWNRRIGK